MGIHYNCEHIQDTLRYATKEAILYMITEAPDNDGNCPAPKGFIRHSDGHLEPDFTSSDYERAFECLKEYVVHASYIIDAWRGKPKGSAMEIVNEAMKANEFQYFALEYVAKGFMKTIEENNLAFGYYLADARNVSSGSGYPDFAETGSGAAESALRAIELSTIPNPETMSIMETAVYMATHDE